MSAIVKHGFNQEQVELIKSTLMAGKVAPTDNDLALYLTICRRTKLDPFTKQVYAIHRGNKWSFDIAIDGYRAIADRTGTYAGSDEPLFDEGLDLYEFETSGRTIPRVCKVTVYKLVGGIRCPFVGASKYSEFCQTYNGKPSGMWEKMPCNQMAIAAERQALRKAFPQCNDAAANLEAIDVEAVPEDWRVKGYEWGISQGVDPDDAREIANIAKDKGDLLARLKSAIPTVQTVG